MYFTSNLVCNFTFVTDNRIKHVGQSCIINDYFKLCIESVQETEKLIDF